MRLLHTPTPIDIATIALWLGHESLDTTNKYIHADMDLKRRELDRTAPTNAKPWPLPAARRPSRVPGESLTDQLCSTDTPRSRPAPATRAATAT